MLMSLACLTDVRVDDSYKQGHLRCHPSDDVSNGPCTSGFTRNTDVAREQQRIAVEVERQPTKFMTSLTTSSTAARCGYHHYTHGRDARCSRAKTAKARGGSSDCVDVEQPWSRPCGESVASTRVTKPCSRSSLTMVAAFSSASMSRWHEGC